MASAACGDDSSSPGDTEGGRASGGAKASGGSGPASAGAGGGATQAGSGPGGAGDGGAGGNDGGAGGSEPVPVYPERDIELTELDIDLATQTGTASITLAPSSTSGATFNARGLTIRSISLNGEPVPYEARPSALAVQVPASAELPAGNRRAWYPAQCNLIDVVSSGLFNRVTYLKGAFFLRASEQKIGRPAFDEALHTFYTRFAGDAARVQDLLDVVSEVTDYDPQDCAEAWLASSSTIPEFGPCP